MAEKDNNKDETEMLPEPLLVEEKPVDETVPPPAPPEQTFTRYEFGTMPGVILIVPDNTPPAEMIRIGATVAEEIGLLMLRKTNNALMVALLK